MTILVNPARFRLGADTPAGVLLGDEPSGLAIDFTAMQAVMRDDALPLTVFSGSPASLLTYTAPFSKHVWNAAGVLVAGTTLRCDHDPITHAPLGVLIEDARQNMVKQSAFASGWTLNAATSTAGSTIGPDGIATMRLITASAGFATHMVFQGSISGASGTNTISVYAKAGTSSFLYLTFQDVGSATVVFDISNGTVGQLINTTMGAPTAKITHVGNGIYRCSATSLTGGISFAVVGIAGALTGNTVDSGNRPTFTAAGTETIEVWGAQLEAGPVATSYVPTAAAVVTRTADNISILASAIPPVTTALAAMADFTPNFFDNNSVGHLPLQFWNTATNYSYYQVDCTTTRTGQPSFLMRNGTQVNIVGGVADAAASGVRERIAWSYNSVTFRACRNAAKVGADVAASPLPAPITIQFGSSVTPAFHINGHLHRMSIVPRLKSDAELIRDTAA